MMQKLLVAIIALAVNLGIQWYADNGGRIADSGSLFGWEYDSIIVSSTLYALKFVWLLIIINIATVISSKIGIEAFSSFFVYYLIFIASAPIAALIYNSLAEKTEVS
jgi:hypothetical protein